MLSFSISLPVNPANADLLRRLMLVVEASTPTNGLGGVKPATVTSITDAKSPPAEKPSSKRGKTAKTERQEQAATEQDDDTFGDAVGESVDLDLSGEAEEVADAGESEGVTLDGLRKEMQKTVVIAGEEVVRGIFKQFKVSRVSDVPEKKRQQFFAHLKSAQAVATPKGKSKGKSK